MMSSIDQIQDYFDDKIFKIIEKYNITTIIDWGCGLGERLIRIEQKYKDKINLIGIDVFESWGMDEYIPKDTHQIKFIDRDKEQFKHFINQNKCDLIITTFSLHHFKLPIQELKLMESILSKNGYLYIGDMSLSNKPESVNENISSYVGELISSLDGNHHRHNYSLEEAKDLLFSINANIIESEYKQLSQNEESLQIEANKRIEQLKSLTDNMVKEKYPTAEIYNLNLLVREYMKSLYKNDPKAAAISTAFSLLAQKN